MQNQKPTLTAREPSMAEDYGNYASSSSSSAIQSSNIGFQLLKKNGWKEGTGLGALEQGRLEPVETRIKTNKRGLGAEKVKTTMRVSEQPRSSEKRNTEHAALSKAQKAVSKRMRKMAEREKKLQEKEFERAFFREFWPDNV